MQTAKKKTLFIIVAITILAVFLFLFAGIHKQADMQDARPSVRTGILDLSGWNKTQDGLINLTGEWTFYWEQLLRDENINDKGMHPSILVRVPDVWNDYKINGKNLPGYGYATFVLDVKNVQKGKPLAIRMPTVSTAYELYVDNQLIASNGLVGVSISSYAPEYRPAVAVFTPLSEDFNLILQVSNFSYARGGVWYAIPMGTQDAVERYDRMMIYKDMFLIGAFLIMALFFFSCMS